jgi:hypothetical protein
MATRRAQIISKPVKASIIAPSLDALPAFVGDPSEPKQGTETVLCGTASCDAVIAQNVWPGNISDMVVLCPKCQGYNLVNV